MQINKNFEVFAEITEYEGSLAVRRTSYLLKDCEKTEGEGCFVEYTPDESRDCLQGKLTVTFTGNQKRHTSVSLGVRVKDWGKSNYVLMPGAVYNGNRFEHVDVKYPPFVPEKLRNPLGKRVQITDIPRLSDRENQSQIQLLSADMTCPMIGFYNEKEKTGYLLQSSHRTSWGYNGYFVRENLDTGIGELRICAPGVRENTYYRMTDTTVPSDDEGILFKEGDRVEIPFSFRWFSCKDVTGLFEAAFLHRYDWDNAEKTVAVVPFSQAFKAVSGRFETAYYDETEHFYGLGDRKGHQFWQTGWVGGGMAGYPLLRKGNAQMKAHALETLNFMFEKLQNENGWLAPVYLNGEIHGDTLKFFTGEEETEADKQILLIRKNADALYFVVKQLIYLKEEGQQDELLINGARMLCDAFVKLWERNGQLGQFINMQTNEIVIGGSASGAIAAAALALADQLFGEYLNTAEEIGAYYCTEYLEKGILNGGPGEILQCPDSESTFGMLESCVELYLASGKDKWKEYAVKAAHHAASWVMSYDFDFPKNSTNKHFGMQTVGTVFANAQNKHSAPGICTLSGDSLLKLYRITRNPAFLRLLSEISGGLMQFVQTQKRLIPTIMDKKPTSGCVCERVQTSDWEGKDAVGEILAPTSVWPEVSALLTRVELPGIYVDSSENRMVVFDHLRAELAQDGAEICVTNPTDYDAETEIRVENENQTVCRKHIVEIKAKESTQICI